MKRPQDDPQQVLFSFAAPVVQQLQDGSFRVTPGKPVAEMTPAQAAKRLGIHRRVIYTMIEDGTLVARRPAKRKYLITAASVEAHYKATLDLDFWEKRAKSGRSGK